MIKLLCSFFRHASSPPHRSLGGRAVDGRPNGALYSSHQLPACVGCFYKVCCLHSCMCLLGAGLCALWDSVNTMLSHYVPVLDAVVVCGQLVNNSKYTAAMHTVNGVYNSFGKQNHARSGDELSSAHRARCSKGDWGALPRGVGAAHIQHSGDQLLASHELQRARHGLRTLPPRLRLRTLGQPDLHAARKCFRR